jgi:hypothetical protein
MKKWSKQKKKMNIRFNDTCVDCCVQRRTVPEVSFARVLQRAAVAGVDAAFAIFIFVVTLPHQFFLALLACVAHVPANRKKR